MKPLLLLLTWIALPAFVQASELTNKQAPPVVALETSLGRIVLELDPVNAPVSTENFLAYVDSGHYDGTIFHRVIDGFVAQAGGYTVDFQEKPTRQPIANEASNGVSNQRGTLAMARTMAPHSAMAQFYINIGDNAALDHMGQHSPRAWGYAVFGKVIDGMPVIDRMAAQETGRGGPFPSDVPAEPIVIHSAARVEDTPVEASP